MDSEALTTFLRVCRDGGVSAAAEKLGRTQSAISRRLAQLEAEVGAPLFERIGRRMVLTDAGAALLPHADRVSAAIEDAAGAVRAVVSGDGGDTSLALVGTLAGPHLTAILRQFRAACPHSRVAVRTAASTEVSELVAAGEVSLGLRYFDDSDPGLTSEVVYREPLVVACAPDHPLAGARVASLAELVDQQWFAFPDHERRREIFSSTVFVQFLVRGIDRFNWSPVDSLTAQKRLVEAGFGIALLQMGGVTEELDAGSLSVIGVADMQARMPVAMVMRRRGAHGLATDMFAGLVRTVFADAADGAI